jgi:hypothetical protein
MRCTCPFFDDIFYVSHTNQHDLCWDRSLSRPYCKCRSDGMIVPSRMLSNACLTSRLRRSGTFAKSSTDSIVGRHPEVSRLKARRWVLLLLSALCSLSRFFEQVALWRYLFDIARES